MHQDGHGKHMHILRHIATQKLVGPIQTIAPNMAAARSLGDGTVVVTKIIVTKTMKRIGTAATT